MIDALWSGGTPRIAVRSILSSNLTDLGGMRARPLTEKGMVELFASVLRKDEDGVTYLVTPVEKLSITVERGHFVAVRLDAKGEGEDQRCSSQRTWAMKWIESATGDAAANRNE